MSEGSTKRTAPTTTTTTAVSRVAAVRAVPAGRSVKDMRATYALVSVGIVFVAILVASILQNGFVMGLLLAVGLLVFLLLLRFALIQFVRHRQRQAKVKPAAPSNAGATLTSPATIMKQSKNNNALSAGVPVPSPSFTNGLVANNLAPEVHVAGTHRQELDPISKRLFVQETPATTLSRSTRLPGQAELATNSRLSTNVVPSTMHSRSIFDEVVPAAPPTRIMPPSLPRMVSAVEPERPHAQISFNPSKTSVFSPSLNRRSIFESDVVDVVENSSIIATSTPVTRNAPLFQLESVGGRSSPALPTPMRQSHTDLYQSISQALKEKEMTSLGVKRRLNEENSSSTLKLASQGRQSSSEHRDKRSKIDPDLLDEATPALKRPSSAFQRRGTPSSLDIEEQVSMDDAAASEENHHSELNNEQEGPRKRSTRPSTLDSEEDDSHAEYDEEEDDDQSEGGEDAHPSIKTTSIAKKQILSTASHSHAKTKKRPGSRLAHSVSSVDLASEPFQLAIKKYEEEMKHTMSLTSEYQQRQLDLQKKFEDQLAQQQKHLDEQKGILETQKKHEQESGKLIEVLEKKEKDFSGLLEKTQTILSTPRPALPVSRARQLLTPQVTMTQEVAPSSPAEKARNKDVDDQRTAALFQAPPAPKEPAPSLNKPSSLTLLSTTLGSGNKDSAALASTDAPKPSLPSLGGFKIPTPQSTTAPPPSSTSSDASDAPTSKPSDSTEIPKPAFPTMPTGLKLPSTTPPIGIKLPTPGTTAPSSTLNLTTPASTTTTTAPTTTTPALGLKLGGGALPSFPSSIGVKPPTTATDPTPDASSSSSSSLGPTTTAAPAPFKPLFGTKPSGGDSTTPTPILGTTAPKLSTTLLGAGSTATPFGAKPAGTAPTLGTPSSTPSFPTLPTSSLSTSTPQLQTSTPAFPASVNKPGLSGGTTGTPSFSFGNKGSSNPVSTPSLSSNTPSMDDGSSSNNVASMMDSSPQGNTSTTSMSGPGFKFGAGNSNPGSPSIGLGSGGLNFNKPAPTLNGGNVGVPALGNKNPLGGGLGGGNTLSNPLGGNKSALGGNPLGGGLGNTNPNPGIGGSTPSFNFAANKNPSMGAGNTTMNKGGNLSMTPNNVGGGMNAGGNPSFKFGGGNANIGGNNNGALGNKIGGLNSGGNNPVMGGGIAGIGGGMNNNNNSMGNSMNMGGNGNGGPAMNAGNNNVNPGLGGGMKPGAFQFGNKGASNSTMGNNNAMGNNNTMNNNFNTMGTLNGGSLGGGNTPNFGTKMNAGATNMMGGGNSMGAGMGMGMKPPNNLSMGGGMNNSMGGPKGFNFNGGAGGNSVGGGMGTNQPSTPSFSFGKNMGAGNNSPMGGGSPGMGGSPGIGGGMNNNSPGIGGGFAFNAGNAGGSPAFSMGAKKKFTKKK